jgi:hypothetical protein
MINIKLGGVDVSMIDKPDRKQFLFEYDTDDYPFYYLITFEKDVSTECFRKVMKLAKQATPEYSVLYDTDGFCKEHGITSFEELHYDWQDYKEDSECEGYYDEEVDEDEGD